MPIAHPTPGQAPIVLALSRWSSPISSSSRATRAGWCPSRSCSRSASPSSAVAAVRLLGLAFDVYAETGLVVLIALAAKNAILLVDFALAQRGAGRSPLDSAVEGARLDG